MTESSVSSLLTGSLYTPSFQQGAFPKWSSTSAFCLLLSPLEKSMSPVTANNTSGPGSERYILNPIVLCSSPPGTFPLGCLPVLSSSAWSRWSSALCPENQLSSVILYTCQQFRNHWLDRWAANPKDSSALSHVHSL